MFEDHYGKKKSRLLNKRKLQRVGVPVGLALVLLLPLGVWINRDLNQGQAQDVLREFNQALQMYYVRYQGYPDKLERLRGAEEGNPERGLPERARLLATSVALTQFETDGYLIHYRPQQRQQRWAATVPLFGSYELTAESLGILGGGISYSTDESGRILSGEDEKESELEAPAEAGPAIKATPAQDVPEE